MCGSVITGMDLCTATIDSLNSTAIDHDLTQPITNSVIDLPAIWIIGIIAGLVTGIVLTAVALTFVLCAAVWTIKKRLQQQNYQRHDLICNRYIASLFAIDHEQFFVQFHYRSQDVTKIQENECYGLVRSTTNTDSNRPTNITESADVLYD